MSSLPPALLAESFTEAPPSMPATPLPAQWTFWVDRTVDRSVIGPVQPTGFSFTSVLSGFGSGSLTLPVQGSPFDVNDLLLFWSWRLWAFYAGVPVWCGCPTGLTDKGEAATEVTLTELSGYLNRRAFDAVRTYTQVEQTEIARQIAAVVADVGVSIALSPGPGFPRDRQYAYLEGQSRAELLSNLSSVLSGPEFRTEYAMSAGRPAATLRIAYPRVGTDTGLAFTVPGNLVGGFQATWDADQFRTHTIAVGDLPENAPEGASQPVVIVDRPQAAVPRLDSVDNWDGVVLLSTLHERANTNAEIYATPVLDLGGSVFESQPPLGSYRVGDTVTVTARTPLMPEGLTLPARLAEMSVDAATGSVTWKLAITQPPSRPRATLSRRLAANDSITASMFKRNVREPV